MNTPAVHTSPSLMPIRRKPIALVGGVSTLITGVTLGIPEHWITALLFFLYGMWLSSMCEDA